MILQIIILIYFIGIALSLIALIYAVFFQELSISTGKAVNSKSWTLLLVIPASICWPLLAAATLNIILMKNR